MRPTAQLNNLYNLVNAATSVGALLAANAPAAAANFTQVAGAPADAYTPLALYDIGVSAGAERIIAQGGNATIPLSVPGVTNGALVVAVCWDRAGNSRVVPAAVAGSVVYLNVTTSGPVMILVRAR